MKKIALIIVIPIIICISCIFLFQKKWACGDSLIINGKKHSTIEIDGKCFWSEKYENSISSQSIPVFAHKVCQEDLDCKSIDPYCGCCKCVDGDYAINNDWYLACPPKIQLIQQIECSYTKCKMDCNINYETKCNDGYCKSFSVDRKNNK